MKRLFILLSFFALMGLNCQAQIQNKIYDFVLGQTTKNEVKNYFNLKSEIEFEEDKTDGGIEAYGLRFGGCTWDSANFIFHKGRLEGVIFSISTGEDTSEFSLNSMFERLGKTLSRKYKMYLSDLSNPETYAFDDKVTLVFLSIREIDGGEKMLVLSYADANLSMDRMKGNEDEL